MLAVSGRAVLFDLDNTLHDRDAGLAAFVGWQHEELGLGALGVSVEAWTRRFVELDGRGSVWKDVVYERLREEFALPHDAETLLSQYVEGFAQHVVPFPDLRSALEALRGEGWKIGIVTNGRGSFQRSTIRALDVAHLPDAVVVSEECDLRKPQRDIFELALDLCECSADGSWFIGDDLVADVRGAQKAGMGAVLFDPWRTEPAAQPRIEKLGDALDAIVAEDRRMQGVLRSRPSEWSK